MVAPKTAATSEETTINAIAISFLRVNIVLDIAGYLGIYRWRRAVIATPMKLYSFDAVDIPLYPLRFLPNP